MITPHDAGVPDTPPDEGDLGRWPLSALRWWWRTTWSNAPLTDDEVRLERQLGWVRLLGGIGAVLGLAQSTSPLPGWVRGLFVVALVGLFVAAAVTAWMIVSPPPSRRRVLELLSLLDAVFLAMLLPFGVDQDLPFVVLVVTLSSVLGGIRLGRLGVLRNLAIATPFETARLVLGASAFDNQSVQGSVAAIAAGFAVGILVGDLASASRRARGTATRLGEAAARDRVRVRRLRWELDVVDDVVHAAGTGEARPALEEAVERVGRHLRASRVHLLDARAAGGLSVWCSTDLAVEPGTVIDLLPGGPRDRALSLGTVAAATHDDLAAMAGEHGLGSVVAAPLPVAGHLVGLLVCETAPGDLLHRRDAVLLGRLGRALAPFLRGARTVGRRPGEATDGAVDTRPTADNTDPATPPDRTGSRDGDRDGDRTDDVPTSGVAER